MTGVLKERDGEFYWVSQVNGSSTWHKFRNKETFTTKMLEESQTPLEQGNYFVEFEEELKLKGIRTR